MFRVSSIPSKRTKITAPSPQDLQIGGAGNDVFYVNDSSEVVLDSSGADRDVVYANANWVMTAGSRIEVLSALSQAATAPLELSGNEFANEIYGNAGSNFVDGGGGADYLAGFGGSDTYVVDQMGDIVSEAAGEGRDVVYATGNYALTAGMEIEVLSALSQAGTSSLELTGNDIRNEIYGNAGSNFIDGGGGADYLAGLGGNDIYVVDNGSDYIAEAAGGGRDVVYAKTSFTLTAGAEVEVLSVISQGAGTTIDLTGNELFNELYGNAQANFLDGGTGADYLAGFGGNDTYVVDTLGDIVSEGAGEGNRDAIFARADYVLAAGTYVEVLAALSQAETTALQLTGNEIANEIYGNAGANFIDGGGGADYLAGLGGNDVYIVDSAADFIAEGAGEGTRDVAYLKTSFTLAAGQQVEVLAALSQAATSALNIVGNEFANEIFGNAGANLINGGAGADYLLGFGGEDSFAFTTALGGGNIDTLADFDWMADKILLAGGPGEPFAALATGTLQFGTVVTGTQALEADDYLIYNSATGALFYDADGNGAGAAVQFATLPTGLTINIGQFFVTGAANNAPVISSAAAASVAENSPTSTIVYQAAATDADGDRITWTLTGADASRLTIDASGAVRLISSPDFETKSSYAFNVLASDSGATVLKAVTLTITDVTETVATPIINETSAPNDAIGQAQVISRGTLVPSNNPNLFEDDYPSATIVGSISVPSDKDFFSITLEAGELLVLDIDGTTGGLDSFLALYDRNLQLIGDNDDLITFDTGSNPPFGHNTDSQIRYRAGAAGTYYFSVASFSDDQGPTSSGGYQLHVSIGPRASAQQLIKEDVDALVSGASWNHTNLTYGFPTSASQYPTSFTEPDDGFGPFTAAQQNATRQLLQLVANVTPLTFTENSANPGQADLRYAMSNEPDAAYAYYPTNDGPGSLGGTAWFNHQDFSQPVRGSYDWMGILHETGHALGLKHGHEFPLAISADRDSVEFSVMTYRSYVGDDLSGYSNEEWGYPQTLMMYDIAALQKIYGANYAFNGSDTVYAWSPSTGEMSINGAGQGAPGNGIGGSANRIFMTVWDGGGNDTYDLSGYSSNLQIDLRPGEWSLFSAVQRANLGPGGQFARGNVANALLFNDDPRSLIENVIGGSGNDGIVANQAVNRFTGGGGNDVFTWHSIADSRPGQADTVTDFTHGSDRLSFVQIDAMSWLPGDNAFTFIGTDPFTSAGGQLRYEVIGGNAHVFVDLEGDMVADMEIIVNNTTTLSSNDFFF